MLLRHWESSVQKKPQPDVRAMTTRPAAIPAVFPIHRFVHMINSFGVCPECTVRTTTMQYNAVEVYVAGCLDLVYCLTSVGFYRSLTGYILGREDVAMKLASRITMTDEQGDVFTRWSRGRSTPVRLMQRAKIVLLAAEGTMNKDIAAQLGIMPNTVVRGRRRGGDYLRAS